MENFTGQWDSEGFDQTSDSESEYLMLSDSSTSISPAQHSSLTMDRDASPHSVAYIVSDVLSREEKLSKRKDLLRDRLRELQDRAEVYDNPLRSAIKSQGGRSFRVTEDPKYCAYLNPPARCTNLDEQSYWSSQGHPRIPFVWEEKPGRPKHFESDQCFTDCNDEFNTNFSDEESVEFLSANDEFVDVNNKKSPLKLPPRLQQKSQSTDSLKSFIISSSDDSESPKLCYEDRMQIMSTRKNSLFLPSMHLQEGAADKLPTSDRGYMRVFSLPAELVSGSRGDAANQVIRSKHSPGRNGLEVLLASFSPDATEQPRRFLILKDRILNAAILEKSRRILQSHGRSNLQDSQSCNKSENERDHKNKRTKAKKMTKKLYASFGCGRSSDVIVPAANRPIQHISF